MKQACLLGRVSTVLACREPWEAAGSIVLFKNKVNSLRLRAKKPWRQIIDLLVPLGGGIYLETCPGVTQTACVCKTAEAPPHYRAR